MHLDPIDRVGIRYRVEAKRPSCRIQPESGLAARPYLAVRHIRTGTHPASVRGFSARLESR